MPNIRDNLDLAGRGLKNVGSLHKPVLALDPPSGEATFESGREAAVNDLRAKPSSRVVVAPLGEPSGRWWVKERADGRFVVASSAAETGVPFFYLLF